MITTGVCVRYICGIFFFTEIGPCHTHVFWNIFHLNNISQTTFQVNAFEKNRNRRAHLTFSLVFGELV